ncbi:hypothetical protein [Chengkuizengella axinellae]|uniref:Uncharacterized protein n=1 Tax=Chengkuizengella axinellae TaxID=3064388 RepID=A0ABT9IZQ8_9BACL|nr:hypothetical protein [Chengkuizengella sp. 2205SS18-9]MDP5274260.1 hypothetical protein [Chengkuizengella sp. 2205SS18-9]
MKNTKKVIATVSLSALLLGGGLTALSYDTFAANDRTNSKSVEISQNSILKARTLSDFSEIQYKDLTFGEFYGGFSIDYNENSSITLTSSTGKSIVVDHEIFNKYSNEDLFEPLFELDNVAVSNEEIQELKRKEASIIRTDPWVMMYNEIESKNIDTEGKTFGQLYDKSDLKKLESPDESKYLYYAEYYGLESENKTPDEIKDEVLAINATLKLKEESRDLPYDPNWLIEEEKWWIEIYGSSPVNQ